MKWFAITAAALLTLIVSVYVILFTGVGNRILSPLIAARIESTIGQKVRIENFELRMGRFALALALDEKNRIQTDGRFSLFSRSIDARYHLRLDDLARLKPLTKRLLRGRLYTDGTVTGTLADLCIEGQSELAQSNTTYRLSLEKLRPLNIQAEVKNASMAALLTMIDQKPYADARLNLLADMTRLDPAALAGNIVLRLSDGELDRAAMKKDFDIDLPQTRFSAEAKAGIDKSAIRYTASMASSLAQLNSKGSLTPEPLQADLTYDIDIKELSLFRPITDSPLRGPFSTRGTVQGDRKKMTVAGRSDVAGSDTTYDLDLKELKPGRVIAKIQGAELSRLLHLAGQPDLASGKLNVNLRLDSLDPADLQGKADIRLSRGVVNTANMKKHYGIELPETTLTISGDAHLNGKKIRYSAGLFSNLAKIDSNGTVMPQAMAMDLKYDIGVKKLELFTPLTGMAMRGPLALSGTARGDKKSLRVVGQSDLAASETRFNAELRNFKPHALQAKIKHLKLKRLLSMLAQPPYADAVLDAEVAIDDARAETLNGKITAALSKGTVDRATLAKEFDLKAPEIVFDAQTASILAGNRIDTTATVSSSLATVKVDRARYNVKEALLTSDYRADIADLDRLAFVTGRRLRGAMRITGEIKKGKALDVTARADTLGGAVDARLHNEDLHADLKDLKTLELLKMFIYPQVFESGLTGALDYNIKAKKGQLDATLSDGRFVPTLMTTLISRLARFDLTREVFQGKLTSNVDDEKILSDVALSAKNASVTGNGIKLNAGTRQIDARLNIVANDNPVGVIIRGDVDKPKVDVDVKNLLQREAERYIEKQVGGQFKNLLKGLFK